jgi:hypothetical protein
MVLQNNTLKKGKTSVRKKSEGRIQGIRVPHTNTVRGIVSGLRLLDSSLGNRLS